MSTQTVEEAITPPELPPPLTSELISVAEACILLRVTSKTLRAWARHKDADGKPDPIGPTRIRLGNRWWYFGDGPGSIHAFLAKAYVEAAAE